MNYVAEIAFGMKKAFVQEFTKIQQQNNTKASAITQRMCNTDFIRS